MTKVREANFQVDLPGEWTRAESTEDNVFEYRCSEGDEELTVTLLGVRPMFQIADPLRLVSDYMGHRAKFEKGREPNLVQSEQFAEEREGVIAGGWSDVDEGMGRRRFHAVMQTGTLLADFAYSALEADAQEFAERASEILSTAAIAVE